MNTIKNTIKHIGLIECGLSDEIFQLNHISQLNGYSIKKALVTDNASAGLVLAQHPEVEIVGDKNAILHDSSIDLVIVLSPGANDMNMVGEVLQAGKQVRII